MIFNKNVLFIHIQKTAGMSITKLLYELLPPPLYVTVPKGHEGGIPKGVTVRTGKRHGTLTDAETDLVPFGLGLSSFKVIFTCIRNPYDMEVSRYFHLRRPDSIKKLGGPLTQLANSVDFETFAVEAKLPVANFIDYWTINNIKPDNFRFVRFENLTEDLTAVLQEAGINSMIHIPHVNKSSHGHYSEYLTKRAEEAVYNKYKDLFDLGYYPRSSFA